MREYGRIHSAFWSSATIGHLSDDGKLLALYLLTSQHSNIAGIYRLPDGYAAEDLGWSLERVAEGFAELSRVGFAARCRTTKWVWVLRYLEWNPLENPNQEKSASRIAQQIPPGCSWLPQFYEANQQRLNLPPLEAARETADLFHGQPANPSANPFTNPSATLAESGTGTGTGTGTEKPPKPAAARQAAKGDELPPGFAKFWSTWPKNERKQDRKACVAAWKRHGFEGITAQILADVAVKCKTKKWAEGYVEAPLVYLNNRRWEDGVTPATGTPEEAVDWRATAKTVIAKGIEVGCGEWSNELWAAGKAPAWPVYQARVERRVAELEAEALHGSEA